MDQSDDSAEIPVDELTEDIGDDDDHIIPLDEIDEDDFTDIDADEVFSTSPERTFTTEFRREVVDHELCFDVDTQARALSHVFQTAKGEFCFAVFGRWGRGKTTLLRRVKAFLTKPDRSLFPRYSSYSFVDFSAWKYRTTPETWIFLYESFADAALSRGFLKSLVVTVRTNLIKHGIWPLAMATVIFAWALIPGVTRIGLLFDAVRAIGIITALFIFGLYTGAKRSGVVAAFRTLLTLSRHQEKLGLQATVGSDLKSLIIGWVPLDAFRKGWRFLSGVAVYLAALAFIAWTAERQLWAAYVHAPAEIWTYTIIIPTGLVILLWLIVSIVEVVDLLPKGMISPFNPKRILLCVDDLDRCEPKVMLDVIESLKLLLDDAEINRRLQVVFLVDRQILEKAIAVKYDKFLGNANDVDQMLVDPIIAENREKYFSAHFELPPLNQKQLITLIEAFTAEVRTVGTRSNRRETVREVIWSEGDRDAFGYVVTHITTAKRDYSPRQIRHALFQYQIAKLLLHEMGHELSSSTLITIAKGVAAAVIENKPLDRDEYDAEDPLFWDVLQQVTRSS
jgi:KAP family P-loop domain